MSAVNYFINSQVRWKQRALPWIVCFSASLFFAYELLQLHVMNAIAPMLMRDLALNATQFGGLSATYLLADVIFLLPAGIILDRFSVRKVILVALFLCVIGTSGFCRVQSFPLACLFHFLSGIGNAFCFLSCMMLIARWFPKNKQAFIVGLMITMGMLGGVVAQRPFSILSEWYGWRQALFIDALIGIGLFVLIFLFVQDAPSKNPSKERKEKDQPFWKGMKQAASNFTNIYCGLYTCFLNLPLMIISAVWGTLFLTQVHHIPSAKASFIVSMICMGTIVGSPLYGFISDKIGRRFLPMLFGCITSTCVMLGIMFTPSPSERLLSLLFFLLGLFTSSQVIGYAVISESNPKEISGRSMGLAAFIIMGIPAILQPVTGKLLDWKWDGTIINAVPYYSQSNYIIAFSIFPIAFILSLFTLYKLRTINKKVSKKMAETPA